MENRASTYLPAFLAEISEVHHYSAQTVRAYRSDLERFRVFCGPKFEGKVENIARAALVGRFLAEGRQRGDSPRTVARRASALRSFFKFLARKGLLAGDVSDIFPSIKLPRSIPRYLPADLMKRWLESMPTGTIWDARDRALVLVFYASGARLAEIAGLKWGDIDLDRQRIKVLGKRDKQRLVPIGDITAEGFVEYQKFVLAKYGAQRIADNSPVFLNQRGTPLHLRSVSRILNKHFRMISGGATVHPHLLRHTFATHMLNSGADLMAIKDFLGHESVGTTQIYTNVSGEHLKKTYKRAFPRAGGDD